MTHRWWVLMWLLIVVVDAREQEQEQDGLISSPVNTSNHLRSPWKNPCNRIFEKEECTENHCCWRHGICRSCN